MFSDRSDLDAPPQSHLRRPWSPEPNVYPSSSSLTFKRLQEAHLSNSREQRAERRDATDPSVEALDLADYERTLRTRPNGDAYPPFPSTSQLPHSSSSFPSLLPGESTDYVPSLVSRGPTLSSSHTYSSRPAHHISPISASAAHRHRAFSMSPPPVSSLRTSRGGPYVVDPHENDSDAEHEIDISHFPRWSQAWYDNSRGKTGRKPALDADEDIYSAVPQTQLSMFDPTYVPRQSYDLPPPPLSSAHASRDMLPWSAGLPAYVPIVDPLTKEERLRMLEKEFGARGKDRDAMNPGDGKNPVGTIDAHGRLVTVGPRRRMVLKVMQVLLAAAACVPGIYAAVAIKTAHAPPPAGRPPTIALYVVSVATLLLLLYVNVVRQCCCVRGKTAKQRYPMAGAGMMVLPLGGGGGKGPKNKKSKGWKGGKGAPGQDVQVNLIVDPAAFRPPEHDSSESGSESEEHIPGRYTPEQGHDRERGRRRHRGRRRRGLAEGLAMEARWRTARAWEKRMCATNAVGVVVWGALFVWAMTAGSGGRCPSGGFGGWCNAYNVSLASSCLLAVLFGVGVFFGVQDLHASKESPRTRS